MVREDRDRTWIVLLFRYLLLLWVWVYYGSFSKNNLPCSCHVHLAFQSSHEKLVFLIQHCVLSDFYSVSDAECPFVGLHFWVMILVCCNGCQFHLTLNIPFLLTRNDWIGILWVTSAAYKVNGIVYILFFQYRLVIDAVTLNACSITIMKTSKLSLIHAFL